MQSGRSLPRGPVRVPPRLAATLRSHALLPRLVSHGEVPPPLAYGSPERAQPDTPNTDT